MKDYELRTDTQELLLKGDVQKIEPLIFRLLVFMFENPDRILTHDELIRALWKSIEISSSALFAAISATRNAIGDTGKEQKCIKTVSGAGYRFIAPFESTASDQDSESVLNNVSPSIEAHDQSLVSRQTKLSIAVLPFQNISGDPEQEYFADGLTEDIITNLSKFSELFVIARYSTFTYKHRKARIQEIGRELGVSYLLTGSIQRDLETVRITVQLIDATKGHHLWSERYDRSLDDIFIIRDEVTQTIAATLMGNTGQILRAEVIRAFSKDTNKLDAYDYTLQARHHFHENIKSSNASAKSMLEQATALDPDYALANEYVAWVHLQRLFNDWSEDFDEDLELAFRWAQKAKTLDNGAYGVHQALGDIYLYQREFEKSATAYDRALELNPYSPDVIADKAIVSVYLGQPEKAVEGIIRAMCLNPFYPNWYSEELGWAYAESGEHDQAIKVLNGIDFPHQATRLTLADSYASLGRMEECNSEVQRIVAAEPYFSLALYEQEYLKTEPFKNMEQAGRHIQALRKAGLPE